MLATIPCVARDLARRLAVAGMLRGYESEATTTPGFAGRGWPIIPGPARSIRRQPKVQLDNLETKVETGVCGVCALHKGLITLVEPYDITCIIHVPLHEVGLIQGPEAARPVCGKSLNLLSCSTPNPCSSHQHQGVGTCVIQLNTARMLIGAVQSMQNG